MYKILILNIIFALLFISPGYSGLMEPKSIIQLKYTDKKLNDLKGITKKEEFNIALDLIRAKRFDEADLLLKRLLKEDNEYAIGHEIQGTLFEELEKHGLAIQSFQKAIKLNPNLISSTIKLAVALYNDGKQNESKKYFQDVLKVLPKNHIATYYMGWIYEKAGDYEKAESYYKISREEEPGKLTPAKVSLARIYFLISDYVECVNLLTPLVSQNNNDDLNVLATMYLTSALLDMGDGAKARPYLDFLKKNAPSNINVMLFQAKLHRIEIKFAKALEILEKIIDKEPNSGEAHYEMGVVHILSKDIKKAFFHFDLAEKKGIRAKYHLNINVIRLELGMHNEAIVSLEKFTRATQIPESFLYLAEAYIKVNKPKEALKAIDKINKNNSITGKKDLLLGLIYLSLKKNNEAKKHLNLSIEANPQEIRSWLAIIELLMAEGNTQEAKKYTEKGLGYIKDDINLLYKKTHFVNSDEAFNLLEKILEKDPSQIYALNDISLLLIEKNRVDEAEVYARKSMSLAPESPVIMDTLGWALTQKGNLDEALPLLLKSSELLPDDWEVNYHVGVLMIKRGDNIKGKKILEDVLKKNISENQKIKIRRFF